MIDAIRFDNPVQYMVVNPDGEIAQRGVIHNAVAYRLKDQLIRSFAYPTAGSLAGSLLQITGMSFRTDGSAILGSWAQWFAGATCVATVFNGGTYTTSLMLSATYTATANVTVKAAALYSLVAGLTNSSAPVASFAYAYSTNFNMSCGSGGQMIIQWTVSLL